MAVAAVEIYCLGLALLEEEKHFLMGALPCRKYLLPTSQVCWSGMLEKAWTKASMGVLAGVDWKGFFAGIEIDPDGELEEEAADVEDVH